MARISSTILPAGVNRRYASLAVFILIVLWFWIAFDRPYSFPAHTAWNIYSNSPQVGPMTDIFDFAPIDSTEIRNVCSATQFNEALTFICEDAPGDVAEVRNSILTCVRYAIAAGANIVLPRITIRNGYREENLGNVTGLDYMFDKKHFVKSLGISCPKMNIFTTPNHISKKVISQTPISFIPESFVKKLPSGQVPPTEWRAAFDAFLSKQTNPKISGPVQVGLGRSFLQYPILSDGEEFALCFGKILKIRSDIRTLATTTLFKLSNDFTEQIDFSQPVLQNIFLGVHFSTIPNPNAKYPKADKANFEYVTQSKLYLDQASQSNVSVIYASSDDVTNIAQFTHDAQDLTRSIRTKFDLLTGNDRESLLKLTPDQQAMVDFLVLLKASQFAGVGHSSISWNVALRRHQFARERGHLGGPQALSDELSQIYGTPREYPDYPARMWP